MCNVHYTGNNDGSFLNSHIILVKLRTLHDAEGQPALLELRSRKLDTAEAVIMAVGSLRSSFENLITYSQYAAIKYKVSSSGSPFLFR